VLEALYMQHVGRDVSKQKLAKSKLAQRLPPSVLAVALAAMPAEPRSKSTAYRLRAVAAEAAGVAPAARPQGAGAPPPAPHKAQNPSHFALGAIRG
jgi:hypothetical protein